MPVVFLTVALAAIVWWAIYARWGTMWVGCGAFMAMGYVLGPPLWSPRLGPVTLTVDRLLIAGLGAAFAFRFVQGRARLSRMTGYDWLLIATIAYFTVRCALTPAPPIDGSTVKPWWRLIAAFWIPAALYLAARTASASERSWRAMLWTLATLGGFLSLTAFAEITHQWWAVFPRYISNPLLGTHFGRARGPALNSASLGVMLAVCFWAAWMLLPQSRRSVQAALAGLLVAIAGAVFFTYTRSTWIGLAATLAIIPLFQLPRQWRVALGVGVLLAGCIGLAAFGDRVTNLGRKDSDASAEHSVYQRASFVYVSMRMFRDAPVFGCGFGRFYDMKMPYLADRSQQLELESLRLLDHHNTVLSVLTETGLVGCTLFLALLAAWVHAAWRLARDATAEKWRRAHGLFALATVVVYLSSALFHDLTLSPTEHWALFVAAGISINLLVQRRESAVGSAANVGVGLRQHPARRPALPLCAPSNASGASVMSRPAKVSVLGMSIDPLTMPEAAEVVAEWCRAPRSEWCRYVVTPNVDHAVLYQHHAGLRDAYAGASLVLADGAPVVWASRLLGRPLPERVAGSDLAPALFKRASRTGEALRVFLLGAAPGVAERAAAKIVERWQHVEIVGTLSPPIGFERDAVENDRILHVIAETRPDLLLVGLGAPKQELWVHAHADRLQAKAALCIGATIDFLAGEKRRAPRWMRRVGLEWFHRLSSEPGRLFKRYARDAWVFPQLVWRDWRGC